MFKRTSTLHTPGLGPLNLHPSKHPRDKILH